MSVNKLLVAGAGQMGAGIAQVAAVAGLDVVVFRDGRIERVSGFFGDPAER